jgi:hypothetical protein
MYFFTFSVVDEVNGSSDDDSDKVVMNAGMNDEGELNRII